MPERFEFPEGAKQQPPLGVGYEKYYKLYRE